MAERLQELLSNGSIFAYAALFFGILLENAGIPLPGETALLIGGYLSGPAGGDRLHLWAVIFVSFLGAVSGYNLG
jgi:membrane protein DedA with SNARE-associated domain